MAKTAKIWQIFLNCGFDWWFDAIDWVCTNGLMAINQIMFLWLIVDTIKKKLKKSLTDGLIILMKWDQKYWSILSASIHRSIADCAQLCSPPDQHGWPVSPSILPCGRGSSRTVNIFRLTLPPLFLQLCLPLPCGRWQKGQAGWGYADPYPSPSCLPLYRGDGRAASVKGTQLQLSSIPANPPLSCAASSWASIVQDRAHASVPPLPTVVAPIDKFICLYQRCTASRIKDKSLGHHSPFHKPSGNQYLLQPPSTSAAPAIASVSAAVIAVT